MDKKFLRDVFERIASTALAILPFFISAFVVDVINHSTLSKWKIFFAIVIVIISIFSIPILIVYFYCEIKDAIREAYQRGMRDYYLYGNHDNDDEHYI